MTVCESRPPNAARRKAKGRTAARHVLGVTSKRQGLVPSYGKARVRRGMLYMELERWDGERWRGAVCRLMFEGTWHSLAQPGIYTFPRLARKL